MNKLAPVSPINVTQKVSTLGKIALLGPPTSVRGYNIVIFVPAIEISSFISAYFFTASLFIAGFSKRVNNSVKSNEALSSIMGPLFLDLSASGQGHNIRRAGNRLIHQEGGPHGAYRCKGEDRWVAITVFTDNQWQAFCRVIGNPAWVREKRFATLANRELHADELEGLVETWTTGLSPEDVMQQLQAVGIPAGVVQSGEDLASDTQLHERGFFQRVPDALGEDQVIEAAPYKLSLTPGHARRAGPDFGEHQDYVMREVLGMSDNELAECAISGAFD